MPWQPSQFTCQEYHSTLACATELQVVVGNEGAARQWVMIDETKAKKLVAPHSA